MANNKSYTNSNRRQVRGKDWIRVQTVAEEKLSFLAYIVESSDNAIIGKTPDDTILI